MTNKSYRRQLINIASRCLASAVVLASVGMILPQRASALFGIGDIVFDPSSWAQLVSSDYTLVEQLTQAYKIVTNGVQAYNLALSMAHSLTHLQKSDFVTLAQMAVQDHVSDMSLKGESAGWSAAMNGDPSKAAGAWQAASLGLKDYSALMASQTVGSSRLLGSLAFINAADGSSIKCMQTISQYRSNSAANALGPILKLAISHLDGTASTNSQVAQLNLANAHLNQQGTEMRAQGDVNTCLVEQMIIASKAQRDEHAAALNFAADYQSDMSTNASYPASMSGSFGHYIQ